MHGKKKKKLVRHSETHEKDSGHFSVVGHRGSFVARERYTLMLSQTEPGERPSAVYSTVVSISHGPGHPEQYVGTLVNHHAVNKCELHFGPTNQTKVLIRREVCVEFARCPEEKVMSSLFCGELPRLDEVAFWPGQMIF